MKKKKKVEEKLRLVKEVVRKQLGEATGGRKCLPISDGDPNDGGTNSCAGPP